MKKRVNALVNTSMGPVTVAEVLGVPVDSIVQYGNGYAVVEVADAPEVVVEALSWAVQEVSDDPDAPHFEVASSATSKKRGNEE